MTSDRAGARFTPNYLSIHSQARASSCGLMSTALDTCGARSVLWVVYTLPNFIHWPRPVYLLLLSRNRRIKVSEMENLTPCLVLWWEFCSKKIFLKETWNAHLYDGRLDTWYWRILTNLLLLNSLDHWLWHTRHIPTSHWTTLRNANLEILLVQVVHVFSCVYS